MKMLKYICWILVVIGGLNWGLVGLFNFNLVSLIFGDMTMLARLIYILVGASASALVYFKYFAKKKETPVV